MKKWGFLFGVSFSYLASAQPSIKLHAYSREVTQGTVRRNTSNENGIPVNSSAEPNVNYYFFAEYKGAIPINVDAIWIKGKHYQVQSAKEDSTPVMLVDDGSPVNKSQIVLVPATKSQVISIVPLGRPVGDKPPKLLTASQLHSDLIVRYHYKGKVFYATVKKIMRLRPITNV